MFKTGDRVLVNDETDTSRYIYLATVTGINRHPLYNIIFDYGNSPRTINEKHMISAACFYRELKIKEILSDE